MSQALPDDVLNLGQEGGVEVEGRRRVLLFQLGGDFDRVHDVFVADTDGGDGVWGAALARVWRDAEGLEGRGEVGVFEPDGLVGYAF